MLELKTVSYTYRNHQALRDISMVLPESGIVSLVGPNGSGKSTLLKCINRILKPKGQILFDGKNITDLSISEVAHIFGYVPQDISSAFPLSVFDMVLLGRRPYLGWTATPHDLAIVSQNIASLGLETFSLRSINELSGGERQKVLIATALSQEPRVLLLDEPTSNLDIRHQLDVMKHLRKVVIEKKLLALLAMHDLNLASQYSDQVVMLNQGTLFAQGSPKMVLTKENVKEIYRVNVVVHRHGGVRHIVPVEDEESLTVMEHNKE
jgi:ABC-type cobalamin/Fe3+-siderophores transport systems, ATPase components